MFWFVCLVQAKEGIEMGIYSHELSQGGSWNLFTTAPQTMVVFDKIFGYSVKVGHSMGNEIHQFGSIDSTSVEIGAYFGQKWAGGKGGGRIRVMAHDDTQVHLYALVPPEPCDVVFLSTVANDTFTIGRNGNFSVPDSGAVVCLWHVNTGTRTYKIDRKQMNTEDRIYLFRDNAKNKVTLLNETVVDFEGQIALFRMKMETIESGLSIKVVPDIERKFCQLRAMFHSSEDVKMLLKGQKATTGKDRARMIRKPTPTVEDKNDEGFSSYKLSAGGLAMSVVFTLLIIIFVIVFTIWVYVTLKTRSLKATLQASRMRKEKVKESKERLMADVQKPTDIDDACPPMVLPEEELDFGIPKVMGFDKV